MGRHPEERTPDTPTIGHLWPHHRSMARALVEGAQPGELAEIFGFTPGQITRIINSPMFQVELKRLEEMADEVAVSVRQDLRRMAERAVEVLDEQLHRKDVSEKIRQDAAFDVLNRAGYAKKDRPIHVEGDLYATQINQTNVGDMSDGELRDEVIDLIEGDYEEKGD